MIHIVSGPYQPSGTVRHCDIGAERLDGPWWLARATDLGWEGSHGATCARHSGQSLDVTAPLRAPAPRGYNAALEAQAERREVLSILDGTR